MNKFGVITRLLLVVNAFTLVHYIYQEIYNKYVKLRNSAQSHVIPADNNKKIHELGITPATYNKIYILGGNCEQKKIQS